MQPPKSNICVICGTPPAVTVDHVPPKCLFKGVANAQLRTVPACAICNNGASSDDEDVGDSGAPAFDGDGPLVIGVVSWSAAPGDEEGCGGLTGVTPLLLYRDWVVQTAKTMGSRLAP